MSNQMNRTAESALSFSSLTKPILLVFGGSILLTISSYISIPMIPVPITMQTLAVTTIGALFGWRLGMMTVVFWLLQGAMGLPVFANGSGGIAHLLGPTSGYLFAFPIAAAATGALVERGWNGKRAIMAFLAMLLGNFICLSLGTLWLSAQIGLSNAIALGFAPFLVGAVIKSVMGVAILKLPNAQRPFSL
jgi:biotin transport system substrate-specific component